FPPPLRGRERLKLRTEQDETRQPLTMEPLNASRVFAPSDRTLPIMLARRAEEFGERPLVTAGEETWTYAQARDAAARFAGALASAGVVAGDRVALICSNRMEFVQALLGCAWLGAVLVPVNVASRGAQLQHILSNSGACLLIVEKDFIGNLAHVDLSTVVLEKIWAIGGSTDVRIGGLLDEAIAPVGGWR